jgi:hypothetical protein
LEISYSKNKIVTVCEEEREKEDLFSDVDSNWVARLLRFLLYFPVCRKNFVCTPLHT